MKNTRATAKQKIKLIKIREKIKHKKELQYSEREVKRKEIGLILEWKLKFFLLILFLPHAIKAKLA